ncbi:hypothetical protein RHMOL_Rhmol02G0145800 [Rhododendron molle]|uniref:Uncharacterized protein n=1 Tax=Rhododendron molle TaxID=49168 RepID=A0ACC0PQI6_RHOML|nr:hypothetical protein RHMOL_Rhmol02G0145800 [Rhododendron molle]
MSPQRGIAYDLAGEIWIRREAAHQAAEGSLMNLAGEVLFAKKKIGEGICRIRRDAQPEAEEGSLMNLAGGTYHLEVMPFVRFLLVLFAGEKIGEGIGRIRWETQHEAAEGSLMNLAGEIWASLSIIIILFMGETYHKKVMRPVGFLVLFAGEKIGEGIGRIRREAQHEAGEGSLMNLAGEIWASLFIISFLFKGVTYNLKVLFTGEKIGEGIGSIKREVQHEAAEESLMNLAWRVYSSCAFFLGAGHIIGRSCQKFGFNRSSLREIKSVKELVMSSVGFLYVLFAGEKIGEGISNIRRKAQHEAAEGSLMNLACEI